MSAGNKPKYIWDHQHRYWRKDGGIMGVKWVAGAWLDCWVEPEANGPNCWYPSMAGKLMSFGRAGILHNEQT